MTIQQLLDLAISKNASDLHMVVDFPPQLRINGELMPIGGEAVLTSAEVESAITSLISKEQYEVYKKDLELDFSFDFEGKARFRANIYHQKNKLAAAFRMLPNKIPTISELGLPTVLNKLSTLRQGFILLTGPTGHGKSTTLASIINAINLSRPAHILTIEDPIEYVYPKGKALVSQREILSDTRTWEASLRSALREDPDVVLIGEMRDLETIASAITIAETGHLVLATLHTNSASQSIDRMIDVFPDKQQTQVRLQLAAVLECIISQRLVPTITPGRVAAVEILFANAAAKNMIREAKTYLIDNLIQTSAELGMTTMENSLAEYVKTGKISSEMALNFSIRPDLLMKLLR